jgi:disulfide bond formation protein DsbB
LKNYMFYFAWILALIGALFSLYHSEVLGVDPCKFCWFQRCALFPLAVLLGIAVYRDDRNFIPYGLVLAGSGAILALIQMCAFSPFCDNGCDGESKILGLLTMPVVSMIGFSAIFVLLLLSRKPR